MPGRNSKQQADEAAVIAELRRVQSDTGHGELRVRVRDGRVQLVERLVKRRPGDGTGPGPELPEH